MRASEIRAWGVVLLGLSGCVERTVPPSASLEIEPPAVCLGDDYSTVVALDASSSSARLSLVPAPPGGDEAPLEFVWQLSGDEHEIVAGGLEEARIDVTMAGERPLGVKLTVRNDIGGELVTRRTVAITVDCEAMP